MVFLPILNLGVEVYNHLCLFALLLFFLKKEKKKRKESQMQSYP